MPPPAPRMPGARASTPATASLHIAAGGQGRKPYVHSTRARLWSFPDGTGEPPRGRRRPVRPLCGARGACLPSAPDGRQWQPSVTQRPRWSPAARQHRYGVNMREPRETHSCAGRPSSNQLAGWRAATGLLFGACLAPSQQPSSRAPMRMRTSCEIRR